MSDHLDNSLETITIQPTPGKKSLPPLSSTSNRTIPPVPINMFTPVKLPDEPLSPIDYTNTTMDNNVSYHINIESNNNYMTQSNINDVSMNIGDLDTSNLVPDYRPRSSLPDTTTNKLFNNTVVPTTNISTVNVQPNNQLYTPGQKPRIFNRNVVIPLMPSLIAYLLMLFSYIWLLYKAQWYRLSIQIWTSDWKWVTGCILHCIATIIELIVLIQLLYNRTPFTPQTMTCYSIGLTIYIFAVALFTTPLSSSDMIVPIQTPLITAIQAQWISCAVYLLLNIWLLYKAPHMNVDSIIDEIRQLNTQILQKELRRLKSDGMQLNSTRSAIAAGQYIDPLLQPQPNMFDLNMTQQSQLQSQLVDTSLQYTRPATQSNAMVRSGTGRSIKTARQQKNDLESGKIHALINNTVRKMLHEQLQTTNDTTVRSSKRSSKRSSRRRSHGPLVVTAQDVNAIHQSVLDRLHDDAADSRVNIMRFPTQNW